MYKSERIAKLITEWHFKTMQKPKFRGPKFNEFDYDIESWVDEHMYVYLDNPSTQDLKRAAVMSRRTWNKLTKALPASSGDRALAS